MTFENYKFLSSNLPPATWENVRDKSTKKGGTLGRKKYFFQISSQIKSRIGLKIP